MSFRWPNSLPKKKAPLSLSQVSTSGSMSSSVPAVASIAKR